MCPNVPQTRAPAIDAQAARETRRQASALSKAGWWGTSNMK